MMIIEEKSAPVIPAQGGKTTWESSPLVRKRGGGIRLPPTNKRKMERKVSKRRQGVQVLAGEPCAGEPATNQEKRTTGETVPARVQGT